VARGGSLIEKLWKEERLAQKWLEVKRSKRKRKIICSLGSNPTN
jgi:hypothetical protein